MVYLALDQALVTTGYSLFQDDKLLDYGIFNVSAGKPLDARLGEYWKHLNTLLKSSDKRFDYIFFEDTQKQQNTETFRKLCYVESATILWCYFNELKYKILSPSHWRSVIKDSCGVTFGRKREEQKQVAIDFVKKQFNKDVTSDEADSICLGFAGYKELRSSMSAF